jgi:hypothetical protein
MAAPAAPPAADHPSRLILRRSRRGILPRLLLEGALATSGAEVIGLALKTDVAAAFRSSTLIPHTGSFVIATSWRVALHSIGV